MLDEAVKEKDVLLLKTAKFEETITNNSKKTELYEKKIGDNKKVSLCCCCLLCDKIL